MLLVRDIANPSRDDDSFPTFRHKDWYQGNSWASGVVIPPLLNGRNQESSSEAIAAYEGVGLFGEVMVSLFITFLDTFFRCGNSRLYFNLMYYHTISNHRIIIFIS